MSLPRIALALLFVFAARSHAQPTTIHVVVFHDPRLTSLTDAQTQRVLDRAQFLIKNVCQRDVAFQIDLRLDAKTFLEGRLSDLAPYRPSEDEAINPFAANRDAWREPIRRSLDEVKDLSVIRAMIPDHPEAQTQAEIADVLADHYAKSIDALKQLKAADNSPLLTAENWHRYNLLYWGVALHSLDWTDAYTLYLSNGTLIDTTITATQPTAIPRGAASNVFDLPASRAAMVAYHGIWVGGAEMQPALANLSEDQKLDAIGYVIAQMMGYDILLGRAPQDRAGLGLASLPKSLNDVSEFTDIAKMKIPPGEPDIRRYRKSQLYKLMLRIYVLSEQMKWQEALNEGNRAMDLNLNDRDLEEVFRALQRAQDKLEKQAK